MRKISVCLKLLLLIMFLFCAIGCVTKPAFIPEAKILSFSEYEWVVKSSETLAGPGPNYFSDSNEKARINLWLFRGEPPLNNKGAEIIIKKFEFIPQTEIN